MADFPKCDYCNHSWHGLKCKAVNCDCKGPYGDTPVLHEGPKKNYSKGKW